MSKRFKEVSLTIIIILVFVLIWQILATNNIIRKEYTSYPSAILFDIIKFYQSGDLTKHLYATMYETFAGLLFGSVAGIIVALLIGHLKLLGNVLEPLITIANGIPQIALAPIYIMWFGIGPTSKIFMASIIVFFHVFFTTYGGVKNCEKNLSESAALLGASDIKILFIITLPTISPWIVAGIRSGIGGAMVGAIVGEYLGATSGIGWAISFATQYFDMTRVMSCLLVLLVLGFLLNMFLRIVERRLLKYQNK